MRQVPKSRKKRGGGRRSKKHSVIAAVRKHLSKHAKAAVHKPHHYLTAVGCTIVMWFVHWETAAVAAFWVYALVESVNEKS